MKLKAGEVEFEAEMISISGSFFKGDLRVAFTGKLPENVPLEDMKHPAMPEPPPGEPEGELKFYVYEVKPPKTPVYFKTDAHAYYATVELALEDGFVLWPYSAMNLKAIEKLRFGDD